jgi:hypothetical protein
VAGILCFVIRGSGLFNIRRSCVSLLKLQQFLIVIIITMPVIFSLWLLSQLHACSGALLVTPRPDIAQATRTLIPTPTRIDPREILAIVSDEEETFFYYLVSRVIASQVFLLIPE